jgi:two-component system LytT family sensor kinase
MNRELYSLTWPERLQLAFGLMTIFYPVLLFVNLRPEQWNQDLWQHLPGFAFEFAAGCLHLAFFVCLAECIQRKLISWFGIFSLGMDRPLLNLLFIVLFLLSGALISVPGVMLISFLSGHLIRSTVDASHLSPEYHAHGLRAAMALFTIMALYVYHVILNKHILRRTQIAQDRADQLEKEKVLVQFNTLKNQVSPHFLFNNLSVLTSLVQINPELSEQFIEQLSKTYRYILEQKDQALIALETELDFIASYGFLLKVRFGEKFNLKVAVSDYARKDAQIAPLTLQLLIENALKYNRMSVSSPLIIEILEADGFLKIRNKFQPRPISEGSSGGGLKHIMNQYTFISKQLIWAGEVAGDFVVKVPLIYKNATYNQAASAETTY